MTIKPLLEGKWFNMIHQGLICARKQLPALIRRPKNNIMQASLVIYHLDGHWDVAYFITLSGSFIKQVLQSRAKTHELRAKGKALSTYCPYSHKLELSLKVKFLSFWRVLTFIAEGFSPLVYCFFCYISLFRQLYTLNVIPIFFSLVCGPLNQGKWRHMANHMVAITSELQ